MRQSGFADMSLRDLAAQVGMKAGSLYYHFPS
jgi:AcrR family transcriptional regulator